MAWSVFDYCRVCDAEHQVFIDQQEEPDPKTLFEYHCKCTGMTRRFRYSPMYSELAPTIPPGAIVARRVAQPEHSFAAAASMVIEAAGTAVALHISAT